MEDKNYNEYNFKITNDKIKFYEHFTMLKLQFIKRYKEVS